MKSVSIRLAKLGTAFALLVTINLYLVLTVQRSAYKRASIQSILAEIENETSDQSLSKLSVPLVLGADERKNDLTVDTRVANLKSFLRNYNSPLYDYAELIVETSDENQLDYRLIPAIAIQESGGCKVIPHNSYNCWGYGIYGNTVTRFSSYDEAITTVARGLKKNYIDKGLTTTSAIMSKYTPSSNGSWAEGVEKVLNWIE